MWTSVVVLVLSSLPLTFFLCTNFQLIPSLRITLENFVHLCAAYSLLL